MNINDKIKIIYKQVPFLEGYDNEYLADMLVRISLFKLDNKYYHDIAIDNIDKACSQLLKLRK